MLSYGSHLFSLKVEGSISTSEYLCYFFKWLEKYLPTYRKHSADAQTVILENSLLSLCWIGLKKKEKSISQQVFVLLFRY